MDDLTLGLVISAGTLALMVIIFLLVRRHEARRAAQLLAAAAARGWECTPVKEGRTSGYRFQGVTRSVSWSLETTITTSPAASGSGATYNQVRHTRWESAGAVLANGLALIGPRAAGGPMPELQNLSGLVGLVVQKALELMLGEDAERLPGLREASLGSGALRERYMLWAHDERAARRLLTFEVERALTDWPAKWPPVVKLGPRGLQVDVQGQQLLDPATLEQLVELGVRIVAAWQQ